MHASALGILFVAGSVEEKEDEEELIMSEFKSVEQISDELITLSLVPNSRWQNLLNLDIIKVCQKLHMPRSRLGKKLCKNLIIFLPINLNMCFGTHNICFS